MRLSEEISPELEAIQAYVRKRLAKECKKWGGKSRIARLLGFDPAHIANIMAGRRRVHENMARKLCVSWGMTYSDLERVAMGAPAASKEEPLPNLRATIEWCRDGYPGEFLTEYERLARRTTIDRKRRAWLDDIDKQLRIWADGDAICPLGDPDDRAPPERGSAQERKPPPSKRGTETRALRDGEPSTTRRKVPRVRVLKRAG